MSNRIASVEKPQLVRTVSHSRRYYFLHGKRISEKEAVLLISEGVPCEYK